MGSHLQLKDLFQIVILSDALKIASSNTVIDAMPALVK